MKAGMTGSINISCPRHSSSFGLVAVRLTTAVLVLLTLCAAAQAQGSGSIKGIVRVASGASVAGVVVVATNQVTGKWKRTRSNADGAYSIRLPAGAYRLRVAAPHVAKFEKDKNYGEFAIARGDARERDRGRRKGNAGRHSARSG